MTDKIKAIYDENIQWLTFAELKNGVLLTLMTALIGVILQMDLCIYIKIYFASFSTLIAGIALFSFIPYLNRNEKVCEYIRKQFEKNNKGSLENENVVFYIDIFVDGKDRYTKALKKVLECEKLSKLDKNYIEQIIQISTIASIKYYVFRIGAELSALMVIMSGFCLFLSLIF